METTSRRLRVTYGKCLECNTIAEYYYDLNSILESIVENCRACFSTPENIVKVIVTEVR